MTEPEQIIEHLQLKLLDFEGGYYRQTYKSAFSTAIYYFLTSVPQSFSVLHSLSADEIWHFYSGDPLELLFLHADGSGELQILGTDLENGYLPQIMAPAGTWQGARVKKGGKWTLVGTTMAPGFDSNQFIRGRRNELIQKYPDFREKIIDLTWEEEDGGE